MENVTLKHPMVLSPRKMLLTSYRILLQKICFWNFLCFRIILFDSFFSNTATLFLKHPRRLISGSFVSDFVLEMKRWLMVMVMSLRGNFSLSATQCLLLHTPLRVCIGTFVVISLGYVLGWSQLMEKSCSDISKMSLSLVRKSTYCNISFWFCHQIKINTNVLISCL